MRQYLSPTRALPLLLATLLSPAAMPQKPKPLQLPTTPSSSANAPASDAAMKPYESCGFPDGLQISDIQPMPADVRERPVQSHGVSKSVPVLTGRRITFAYPGAQPFASVKVEQLPAENYTANRKLLLDDFDDIIASDKMVSKNNTHGTTMSGFPVVGLDRIVVSGTTLGIYMLLDDHTHVASTVYLLNPPQSKFKVAADYARARDTFLYNYTRCVRNNQNGMLFGR
jgi:hypothetical protein